MKHDANLFELLVTGMYLFLLPAMISVSVAFVLIGLGIMSKDMFLAVMIIGYFTHNFVCSLGLLRGKKMPNVDN